MIDYTYLNNFKSKNPRALRVYKYKGVFGKSKSCISVINSSQDKFDIGINYDFDNDIHCKILVDFIFNSKLLSPKEKKILQMRYGIDSDCKTLEETAKSFGCSRERIRYIQSGAEHKIRGHFRFLEVGLEQKDCKK
jgi:DNA-binding CsgD family transcriptional regulator